MRDEAKVTELEAENARLREEIARLNHCDGSMPKYVFVNPEEIDRLSEENTRLREALRPVEELLAFLKKPMDARAEDDLKKIIIRLNDVIRAEKGEE